MNSTKAERMNLPIRGLLRADSRADTTTFRARWQSAVETVSGHGLRKLRLGLPHSISELLLTSTHRSNNNDCDLNLLRASHLPVSA
jgi:hypothetical protein